MLRTKNEPNIYKYIVPVAILALSIFLIVLSNYRTVSAKDISIIVDKNLTLTMKDELVGGGIWIDATSRAADDGTNVRYQTIGFGVSISRQNNEVTAKTYTGPAAPSNVERFNLVEASEKIDLGTVRDYNTTRFVFTKEQVDEIIGNSVDKITGDTTFFLNAVFQSYYLSSDGSKTIRNGNITSWEEMMNAETWSDESLEGFRKYYNIEVTYVPQAQPNTIEFEYVDLKSDKVVESMGSLNSQNIGLPISWYTKVTDYEIDKNGKKYRLNGYYIEAKDDSGVITGPSSWYDDKATDDSLRDNVKYASAVVPWGGLDVHIVYKEVPLTAYPNTLLYKYGSKLVTVVELAKKKVGEDLSWSAEASDAANTPVLKLGVGDYELQGYYLELKSTKAVTSFYKSQDRTLTNASILNGTTKVIMGGWNVVLVYANKGEIIIQPTPTPKPGATPTPVPTIPPLEIPAGGSEYKMLDTMATEGKIRADLRGAERFTANLAIPSTESLYTQVRGSEYNIGYHFLKKVVTVTYPIKVSKVFHLQWTDAKDKTKIFKKDVEVVQTVSVERACAYWEIENFDYYTLDKATIYNGALPGGVSVMNTNYGYYSPPCLSLSHSESEDYHIIPPKQITEGIILDSVTLPTGNGAMPTIEKQDFTYEANNKTEQIKVRNDYLSFNGRVVMDNSTYVKESPSLTNLDALNVPPQLCNQNVLYKPDQVIPTLTLNDNYLSNGTLTYMNTPSAVSSSGSTYDAPIRGLENIIVHTPVICDASIKTTNTATGITSNDTYVQALKVDEECIQLVIDPDDNLSDFTVDINNHGRHISSSGYFTREFAWGLRNASVSYITEKNSVYRNEVKFPFDVFYRKSSGEDEFIAKNTWMRFGHNTPTFYLPMWVNEGTYSVEFRSIAVNGVNTDNQLSKTQTYANTDRSNYVAVDTVRVQVSGRIYGLTIYDVTDYPTWETIFRKEKGSSVLKINDGYPSGVAREKYNEGYSYDYTVGLSNQYGVETGRLKRFTLPLVNGSHPKYTNVGVLKTGYALKFKITTTGNAYGSEDSVLIKPKFYYVDLEGKKNRQEVDIYYTESFNNKTNKLVKMGSYLDLTNTKSYTCGDLMMGIPIDQLKIMAAIKNKLYGKYIFEKTDLFTYTSIRMRSPLMTYTNTNYALNLKSGTQYSAMRAAGVTDTDMVRRMQTYYGEYYFPADVKAVEKGFDVYGYSSKYGVGKHEAFWLKGGYIIINFDIVTEDEDGNKNLSYINSVNAGKGYCSMWRMENPVPNKVSYNGKKEKSSVFDFLPGDFMVYYTDKSIKDDYVTYVID